MISVTQVNGSGENGPIMCLGKYRSRKVGEKITIKDTFTFKGSIVQHKLNKLNPSTVQLLITMMPSGPAGYQYQSVPELEGRTVDREPRTREGNAVESEEDNFASYMAVKLSIGMGAVS